MNLIIKHLKKWLLGFFHHSMMAEMKPQTSTTTEKKRIARGVKAFFDRHYELRYNIIKQQEEFRPLCQDEADQKNSDGQNFAAEHQNSCGKHQSATWQQLTDREQAKIKRLLTERDVQTRKMRSDQYVMLPRMASFIATTNDYQPLTDPTGSRRYLCCELTGIIDTDTPIPHKQMYAQAICELEQGHPWYFSKQEEATIEEHNRTYRCQASPESVLLAYYEPAPSCKENFLRAVDIQQELRRHLRQADVPTIITLTKALKSAGFRHGALRGQRGWYARRRSEE